MSSNDTRKTEGRPSGTEENRRSYRRGSPPHWPKDPPHCIYFYFFEKTPQGTNIKYYFYDNGDEAPIPKGLLPHKIKMLVENALGLRNDLQPRGTEFPGENWNRISWLVFAKKGDTFDDDHAIEIEWRNGSTTGENHSFFDGEEEVIQVEDQNISVMWVWNHVRDANGHPLVGSQQFGFRFNPNRPPLEEPDENGTNTGPTIAPPPRGVVPPPHRRDAADGESGGGA